MGIVSAERVIFFVRPYGLPAERTSPVPNSLSVLLPVKNAQATLAATVQEILDVAADLSEQFELLIIDDGSSDATSEIATELTQNYPQVRAVCQATIGRPRSGNPLRAETEPGRCRPAPRGKRRHADGRNRPALAGDLAQGPILSAAANGAWDS